MGGMSKLTAWPSMYTLMTDCASARDDTSADVAAASSTAAAAIAIRRMVLDLPPSARSVTCLTACRAVATAWGGQTTPYSTPYPHAFELKRRGDRGGPPQPELSWRNDAAMVQTDRPARWRR